MIGTRTESRLERKRLEEELRQLREEKSRTSIVGFATFVNPKLIRVPFRQVTYQGTAAKISEAVIRE